MVLSGCDCAGVVELPQEDVRRERRRDEEGQGRVIRLHNGEPGWLEREGMTKRENKGTSMGEYERGPT